MILLEEDPQSSPVPPGSQDLLNSDSTLAGFLAALGFTITNEAILGDIDEEITGLTESILNATEEDILNAIAQYGFLEDFADFGGGGDDDFIVNLANLAAGGDFITDIGGNFIPGLQATIQVEPEPLSILTWIVVCMVGGSLGWTWSSRRRSHNPSLDFRHSRKQPIVSD